MTLLVDTFVGGVARNAIYTRKCVFCVRQAIRRPSIEAATSSAETLDGPRSSKAARLADSRRAASSLRTASYAGTPQQNFNQTRVSVNTCSDDTTITVRNTPAVAGIALLFCFFDVRC